MRNRDGAKVLDLVTAGKWLGIGRSLSYRLAREGRFPSPVIRAGRRYIVPVAPLLRLLDKGPPPGTDGLADNDETPDRKAHHRA